MPNLSFHGQRELSTSLQLQQNDQNRTTREAGTGCITGAPPPDLWKGWQRVHRCPYITDFIS